jgi:hypothetical protein
MFFCSYLSRYLLRPLIPESPGPKELWADRDMKGEKAKAISKNL